MQNTGPLSLQQAGILQYSVFILAETEVFYSGVDIGIVGYFFGIRTISIFRKHLLMIR